MLYKRKSISPEIYPREPCHHEEDSVYPVTHFQVKHALIRYAQIRALTKMCDPTRKNALFLARRLQYLCAGFWSGKNVFLISDIEHLEDSYVDIDL